MPMELLLGFDVRCVGFVGGERREFWVMGGYNVSRMILIFFWWISIIGMQW